MFPFSSPLQARTKGKGMKILDPALTDEGNAAAEGQDGTSTSHTNGPVPVAQLSKQCLSLLNPFYPLDA